MINASSEPGVPRATPLRETGPVLAIGEGVPSAEQLDRWYRAIKSSHLEKSRGALPTLIALGVFNIAVLIGAGYPTWRVLAVVGTAVAIVIADLWFVYVRRRRGALAALSSETRPIVVRFLLTLALIPFTGGIRSPFVPVLLLPVSDLAVGTGWSRPVKILLAVLAASLVTMSVLPSGWFGPDLPHGAYALILLVTLAVGATWHTRYLVSLTRTVVATAFQLRRAREEVVERAIGRARDMEQLAAKLSHELKNPLTAIKGLVQLTARGAHDSDSREQLQVVATEIDRMEGILKEYLSFSRPVHTLRPQAVRLGALADDVLSAMEGRAVNAGVALRRRGDAAVEVDARRVTDALFNLLGNALDATPEGGSVEIHIEEMDQMARIAVRDSGRGMSKEVLERLGTPFFTTREEGTGLGVAVARATFAQHGGSLVYASEPGRGTTAMGILPLRNSQRSSHAAGAVG